MKSPRTVELPYGLGTQSLVLRQPERVSIFEPRPAPPVSSLFEAVEASLWSPIGNARLRDLAKPGCRVVLVVDDITRRVPTSGLLPPILAELDRSGVCQEDIEVIVANGLHRSMNEAELQGLLGDLAGQLKISNHNPRENLEPIGTTSFGNSVLINGTFMKADLKILVGDVEFHQFCGFGGGSKSVFPGLADAESIRQSHSRMDRSGAGPGRLDGNPVRREIEEVGAKAGVDFIVNVVMNGHGEVVQVFSGHRSEAFRIAAKACTRLYYHDVGSEPFDVVIASAGGYPKDIDLYQAQKALQTSIGIVKKSGSVVLVAECREGHGSERFRTWIEAAKEPQEILDRIGADFQIGGHKAYQFARATSWAKVHLYSSLSPATVRKLFISPIDVLSDVWTQIRDDERVAIIPQASLVCALLDSTTRDRENVEKDR